MPQSNKSTVSSTVKPKNVFYVWYSELCKRNNSSPLAAVKPAKPKNNTVLQFNVDRIKPDEWLFILSALRLDSSLHAIIIKSRVVVSKFLYDINSEDKIRQLKKRSPPLYTDFLLQSLVKSLIICMKNNPVLSTLELDGIPLHGGYLELLTSGLRKNCTIRTLSFPHCPINDNGCQHLCMNLRFMPNVEHLNLSCCNLSVISGQYIARLIKHQQIYRYSESWHKSLRYEEPEANTIAGLKRITLNGNQELADEGLKYILDELEDDLWIKAIDMQKCNITETMASRILDIVQYSKALTIADFRYNHLSYETVDKIISLIVQKTQELGGASEHQWCATSSSITDFVTFGPSSTNLSGASILKKTKSSPDRLGKLERPLSLRKTKTLSYIDRSHKSSNGRNLTNFDNQENNKVKELSKKLQEEVAKRREAEKEKNALQKKLSDIRQLGMMNGIISPLTKQSNSSISKQNSNLNCVQGNHTNQVLAKGTTNTTPVGNSHSVGGKSTFPKIKVPLLVNAATISKKKSQDLNAKSINNTAKSLSALKVPMKTSTDPRAVNASNEKFVVHDIFESIMRINEQTNEELEEIDENVEDVINYYYDSDFEDQDEETIRDVEVFESPNGVDSNFNSSQSLENFLQEIDRLDNGPNRRTATKNTNKKSNENSSKTKSIQLQENAVYMDYNAVFDAC